MIACGACGGILEPLILGAGALITGMWVWLTARWSKK